MQTAGGLNLPCAPARLVFERSVTWRHTKGNQKSVMGGAFVRRIACKSCHSKTSMYMRGDERIPSQDASGTRSIFHHRVWLSTNSLMHQTYVQRIVSGVLHAFYDMWKGQTPRTPLCRYCGENGALEIYSLFLSGGRNHTIPSSSNTKTLQRERERPTSATSPICNCHHRHSHQERPFH